MFRLSAILLLCAVAWAQETQTLTDLPYCGGTAQIIGVKVSRCSRLPCYFFGGITYDVEVDFIPMRSSNGFDIAITTVSGASFTARDYVHRVEGQFTAQESYSLRYTYESFDTQGAMTLRTEVFGENGRLEVCREVESLVYNFPTDNNYRG